MQMPEKTIENYLVQRERPHEQPRYIAAGDWKGIPYFVRLTSLSHDISAGSQ